MKVLVTGACGQLGSDVIKALLSRGHEAVGSDLAKNAPNGDCYISLD